LALASSCSAATTEISGNVHKHNSPIDCCYVLAQQKLKQFIAINYNDTVIFIMAMQQAFSLHSVLVQNIQKYADFRPISVTNVLSRIVEQFIVRGHLYHAFGKLLMKEQLREQFAFRPTGTHTGALIAI